MTHPPESQEQQARQRPSVRAARQKAEALEQQPAGELGSQLLGDGNLRLVIGALAATLITGAFFFSVGFHRQGASKALLENRLLRIAELPVSELHTVGKRGLLDRLRRFNNDAFHKLLEMIPFEPRDTDLFLVGVMGSGITLLSQIAHGLRSNGSMAFDEITEVVPWFHLAHVTGQDLDDDQEFQPRLFRSHQLYDRLPPATRHVLLLRDPKDVLLSQYRRFCNSSWLDFAGIPRGSISLEDFAAGFFAHKSRSEVWHHLASWLHCCRYDHNTLIVFYEDIVAQPEFYIRSIAKFMSPHHTLHGEVLDRVRMQSTREFMLEHSSQFDDHFALKHLSPFAQAVDLGKIPRLPKVVPGGPRVEVPESVLQLLEARWRSLVAPTGFRSYGELRQQLSMHSYASSQSSQWIDSEASDDDVHVSLWPFLLGMLFALTGILAVVRGLRLRHLLRAISLILPLPSSISDDVRSHN